VVWLCRSGILALALGVCLTTKVLAQVERIQHKDWFSDLQTDFLADKSVLAEYFGEVQSIDNADVNLRIGFIPRFGCSPLITIQFGYNGIDVNDLTRLRVEVDGSPLRFPVLMDKNSDHVAIFMNVNLQRRIAARIKIDSGSRLRVRDRSGKRYGFSLLGSRDALSIAEQACRVHDPRLVG